MTDAERLLKWLGDALIPRRYLKMRVDYDPRGPWCVIEPHNLADMTEGGGYVVQPVWMTRRQFDALGDFNGF